VSGYMFMQCPFSGQQNFVTDYTLRHTGLHGRVPKNEIAHFDEIGLVEQSGAGIVWGTMKANPDCAGMVGCECGGPQLPITTVYCTAEEQHTSPTLKPTSTACWWERNASFRTFGFLVAGSQKDSGAGFFTVPRPNQFPHNGRHLANA
jgi:hypothetical protein